MSQVVFARRTIILLPFSVYSVLSVVKFFSHPNHGGIWPAGTLRGVLSHFELSSNRGDCLPQQLHALPNICLTFRTIQPFGDRLACFRPIRDEWQHGQQALPQQLATSSRIALLFLAQFC